MSENIKHVATLGNSIIGVSVLAMPFCFKQCGILLGSLMLIASAFITRFNCHLLLKGSLLCRRKTYELFAFHCFGDYGKVVVEASIIGFLVGILISFFVVIGDLGPPIISKNLEIDNMPPLRTIVLTALGLGVALPLGLLKNITSLGGISTVSILFYIILAMKVFIDAIPVLATNSWTDKVTFWQPQGVLQSLPIFALALSCQTQIFEIYNALPDSSLGKMNKVIKMAVYLCTGIYISVGFFGYVAFSNQEFSGNLLVMMPSSPFTQLIKLGFVISVVLSFPLVIFPCRASLYSLFNRKIHTALDAGVVAYIPESRFRLITVGLVVSTLILGILCPNIELVLGIVGSTIGTVICIIFPALMFIRVTNRNTFERTGAQVVFCVGMFLLVASTFVILNNTRKELTEYKPVQISVPKGGDKYESIPPPNKTPFAQSYVTVQKKYEKKSLEMQVVKENVPEKIEKVQDDSEQQRRQEPPIPQEPESNNNKVNEEHKIMDQIQMKEGEKEMVTEKRPADLPNEMAEKQVEILKQLAEQQKEAKKLLQEQKQVLEELKKHKELHKPDDHVVTNEIQGQVEKKEKQIVVERKTTNKTNEIAKTQEERLSQLSEQQIEAEKRLQEQNTVLEELKKQELTRPQETSERSVVIENKNLSSHQRNVVVELLEKKGIMQVTKDGQEIKLSKNDTKLKAVPEYKKEILSKSEVEPVTKLNGEKVVQVVSKLLSRVQSEVKVTSIANLAQGKSKAEI